MAFGPFVGPFGAVTLDGVQFTTDPDPYEPLAWQKRHSVHMGIGGAVTIQDFGVFMKDNLLHLGSGKERFLEESVFLALHTRYRTRGGTFVLTDWLNNNFTVFIKDFWGVPWRKGVDGTGATVSLYMYKMELQVITITTLVGVAYTGS